MSSEENQKDTVIIGPVPPPLGGVSNHIARYSKKYNLPVFSESSIRTLKSTSKIILLRNSKFFVHSESWYIALILILKRWFLNRNCDYYLVNHNFQTITSAPSTLKQNIFQRIRYCFIRQCNKVYVVNLELAPKMKAIYGDIHIELFDPFVPPDESKEEQLMKEFGKEVENFLRAHKPLIISGAWQLSFHKNEDLYGFDLLIELIYFLKERLPTIGLVFFIGNPKYNEDYLNSRQKRIRELGLENAILLISGQKEMWPLIKRSSLFIRATNTDGDPLSIKEALYFGIKVLASDCTTRVKGVRLFKNRSLESLINNVFSILEESNLQYLKKS